MRRSPMHRSVSILPWLLAPALAAQTVVVDYSDSTIGALAGQYPIYTGTGLSTIRGQLFCPGTFANLPTQAMICTRIGVQLGQVAGPITYAQFVMRAGATNIAALTNTWATNLPDQRVQLDLSNRVIPGGPNVNMWFEFPLAFPFHWQPGQGVVLDVISQATIAGQYLRTAIGTSIPRLIDANYVGNATAGAPQTSGGIKFRMVFEPLGLTQWGTGCAGSGSFVPTIGSQGQSNIGSSSFRVTLSSALGGAPAIFSLGRSANLDLGGGCSVYNNLAFLLPLATSGSGPGNGTALPPLFVPNDSSLVTAVFDVQWCVLDNGSQAVLPVATTAGGKIVIY